MPQDIQDDFMKCAREFRASEVVQLLCIRFHIARSHFPCLESQMCKASARNSSLCTLHLPRSMLLVFTFPDSAAGLFVWFDCKLRPYHDSRCVKWYALLAVVSLHSPLE